MKTCLYFLAILSSCILGSNNFSERQSPLRLCSIVWEFCHGRMFVPCDFRASLRTQRIHKQVYGHHIIHMLRTKPFRSQGVGSNYKPTGEIGRRLKIVPQLISSTSFQTGGPETREARLPLHSLSLVIFRAPRVNQTLW